VGNIALLLLLLLDGFAAPLLAPPATLPLLLRLLLVRVAGKGLQEAQGYSYV
jgi:hypothetical protein